MKVRFFFAIWISSCSWLSAQQLIFPEQPNFSTLGEGETLAFKVGVSDSLKLRKFSLEGINGSGIVFDSLGNFFWKPSYDFVDRLEKQKDFSVLFQSEFQDSTPILTPLTFSLS